MVDRIDDLDRLGAQAPVQLVVVPIRQLAGAVVKLGVQKLAVFRVPRRFELGQLAA